MGIEKRKRWGLGKDLSHQINLPSTLISTGMKGTPQITESTLPSPMMYCNVVLLSLAVPIAAFQPHANVRSLSQWAQRNVGRCSGSGSFKPAASRSNNGLSSTALLAAPRRQFNNNYNSSKKRGVYFPVKDYYDIGELVQAANELEGLNAQNIAAVWSRITRLVSERQSRSFAEEEVMLQIRTLIVHTMKSMGAMQPKELTTIILSMAKIVKNVREAKQRRRVNIYQEAFDYILMDDSSVPRDIIFDRCAEAASQKLRKTEPMYLSHLAYEHALLGYDPELEDSNTLLSNIADASISCTQDFDLQGISNMVWAYATLKLRSPRLFEKLGDTIANLNDFRSFLPQALSNIVWAYATADIKHHDLFEKVGDVIVELESLDSFNSQTLSNIVWAYATADIQHYELFEKVADSIVDIDNLDTFDSQGFSNIVWAYATVNVKRRDLFEKVGDGILCMNSLDSFTPQALSNIAWAYATANVQHPGLFRKIGIAIDKRDDLDAFYPQALANIVWAYATTDIDHPGLFQKVGDAIVDLENLDAFNSQNLANTVWAYATAGVDHRALFDKIGNTIIRADSLESFAPQALSNIAWAYAAANELRAELFENIATVIVKKTGIDSFNSQDLTNIAWAYAVADIDEALLFSDDFSHAIIRIQEKLNTQTLNQLYQWHLWRTGEKCAEGLPKQLYDRCRQAFISTDIIVSSLQKDVVSMLVSVGLNPLEEFVTESGFSVDALLEINGKHIGVEVDGPSHFIGRKQTGATVLKHRQVTMVDKIPIVSVPYFEWNRLGKDKDEKQKYLRSLLSSKSMEKLLKQPLREGDQSLLDEYSSDVDALYSTDKKQELPVQVNDDLSSLTVPELKNMLRSQGLKVGGRKAELIERLRNNNQ
jgi:hypothetical protein